MLSKVQSCAVLGLNSKSIEVEMDLSGAYPAFSIVGLPDKAVEEAKERVRSAFKNSGVKFPHEQHLLVNLAPADLRKEGPSYDLPLAVGILGADKRIELPAFEENVFVGELALNGDLRYTKGILPVAIFAKQNKIKSVYLPEMNAKEAQLVEGIEIYPVKSLKQLINHFKGEEIIEPIVSQGVDLTEDELETLEIDMAYVKGQEQAKRALEIAASGGHNVLMSGPPGTGKTLLARAMAGILPQMTKDEIIEVTKIYSVAGLLPEKHPIIYYRPFRTPHHTSSGVALVGGGQIPRPGEISLAHRGVLFLDEFPEFPRFILENLRQPLEDGTITVSRAQASYTFPARFILVAAQNPCPCGYLGDPEIRCTCSPQNIIRYQKRVSGPILDRIDLHIEVPRVKFKELTSEKVAEPSADVRRRVQAARDIQEQRFVGFQTITNSEMGPKQMKKFCQVDETGQELLRQAVDQMHLSARAYYRLLKVARTIADLEGVENIQPQHLAEALQYRQKMGE